MTSMVMQSEAADALWVAQAVDAAPTVASWGAAVIAARDVHVAGIVAVAVARVLAESRRVAIADLVGDLPALTALAPALDDDPHGIADSFRYGVSLNRVARPVDESGSLFVLPSGTEAVAHEEIYRNERWRRLAGGFTEVGASLLIVASPDVPGFDDLVRYVGGLVRVGAQAPSGPSDLAQVMTIETPEPLARATARATDRARRTASKQTDERRSSALAVVALLAALVIVGVMAWPTVRDRLGLGNSSVPAVRDSVAAPIAAPPPPVASIPIDSAAAADSVTGLASPVDSAQAAAPALRNPGDSATAARFSVYLLSANTSTSAVPAVERAARAAGMSDNLLAELAVSPVTFGRDGARWYRVTVGAFTSRASADSLLATLRRSRVLGETSGSVLDTPLAFELERDLAPTAIGAAVTSWRRRGLRPYVLRNRAGVGQLYVGAFETAEQAALFADSLRTLGFTPPLAFRIGRSSP
jgi:hypothetical protein